MKQATLSAKEAKSVTENLVIPQNEKKKSFLNKLRIDLKSEEVKQKGPWTDPATWQLMKRNLTEHKVRKLLGNPDDIKLSLNPRIDRIYVYTGDINSDGEEEEATVQFFRDRVIFYNSPFEVFKFLSNKPFHSSTRGVIILYG